MRKKPAPIAEQLNSLYEKSPSRILSDKDRVIILSDLHMGNGSRQDDFLLNGPLVKSILEDYYLPRGFTLVLNGDIEELQKFSLRTIHLQWSPLYQVFESFQARGRLYKITGNHDASLSVEKPLGVQKNLYQGLRLSYHGQDLFLCHGHQATNYYLRFNRLVGFLLKYIARPLGLKNRNPARESRKRYAIEKRVYQFAADRKLAALIGHTHRPLFESFSKADKLRIEMETLLREYEEASPKNRRKLETRISGIKKELDQLIRKQGMKQLRSSLYTRGILVPALFNSGCCIGKRGITGLEIDGGRIRLIHWFDRGRTNRYPEAERPEKDGREIPFYRIVLDEDSLDYIFARIKLLT